ncbi:ABC transporter permease [Salsipaludibacter albus]|uniref:ABC transporter permease n=1 Tax=Salsipaludibacter albus TaxID=2849650 RepID=UPI001EE3E174|nr:ABC transporter permease subunit [Salsipaludibacter albus]MBY5162901.1 ABC transporter permease subunit [Salsipaludibacter albus]
MTTVTGHRQQGDQRLRWSRIRAVSRRDIASVLRNKGVRIPLLVAPTVILIVLPVLLVAGGDVLTSSTTGQISQAPGAGGLAESFTPDTAEAVTGFSGAAAWPTFILQVFIAPLYLLVPLMVSTVIAADSFAGERDRGTLEPLLHTPTTDRELFIGKFLSAWLPAMVVSLGGFVVYIFVANGLGWRAVGGWFFPTPSWWLLAIVVTPALAALALGVMVLVSSRVQSVQAAHQFGSLVVLPIILLLIGQVAGALLFSVRFVAVLGLVIWVAAAITMRLAARDFNRDRLAERL